MLFKFSTKARTLERLQGHLQSALIAPMVIVTKGEWQTNRQSCLTSVRQDLVTGPWIVRSSCQLEDDENESFAGAFLTLQNVDEDGLGDAIDSVISSFKLASDTDEVLIQPMLRNVIRSGVTFSHDPNTCAPYRVVNWSNGSETATVTGGTGGRIWQQAAQSTIQSPFELSGVNDLLVELMGIFNHVPLDFEFAFTHQDGIDLLWLLQVRPLILTRLPEPASTQSSRLRRIQEKVARGMQPSPFLMGKRTVYGVMPDWNPAEIIGIRPKPLSLSLYRDLVTDAIWAYQRHNYGYRNLRSFPLMPHFFGQPYIDVRVSFNSFIPSDLDEGLAGKLVDFYIERLLASPTLHDKVEFDIVFSCYSFDLPQRLEILAEAGFSKEERKNIAESLKHLTNRIIHPLDGQLKIDTAKILKLKERRDELMASGANPIENIYWLLEDAKRYGTLPFAGLARAGFVAVQILKSLVSVGVFTNADYDNFFLGLSTVTAQMAKDREEFDKVDFLKIYGHLRPGTYDINSPRYDETPELYFDWTRSLAERRSEPVKPFSLDLKQMRDIKKLLLQHGLRSDTVELFNFLQAGIELREQAKFLFTRNLSDSLSLITEYGATLGFTTDELAYCDIGVFKELYVSATDPKDLLQRSIDQGKARYQETMAVSLPPLITSPDDVWAFEQPETSPNFITQKHVTAPVVGCETRALLAGAIVCIPSADPGFDWLFSYPITGLITSWGGANSHMAIRAGEIGLPAVIGVGETRYRIWSGAKRLHLDCAGRRVEILS